MADSKLKLIGAVGVKVRPDASGFRGETQRALTKELSGLSKNVKVNADVGLDSRKAEAEIKNLKRQINALSQGVRLNLETKGLADLKRYNEALEEYKENAEAAAKASDKYWGANKDHEKKLKAEEEMAKSRAKLMQASKDLASSWNDLKLNPLDLKIVNADQIDDQLSKHHLAFRRMKQDADELAEHIENLNPSMDIDLAGTELAAARLAYASRPRTVPFFVTVNQKSIAIAEGMLKSLSGLNIIESAGRHLERLLINFDKATIKGSILAAVVGNIANSFAWLGTSAFSVGGGMAKVVGLLAMAPTSFAAVASVVTINVAAWKNFKGAIDGNAEALAALPPAAREAAKALQGTWKSIQEPVQASFWDGMGESMQRAVAHILDPLRDGLTETSEHVGRFTAGVLDSFTKMAQTGSLEAMFGGVSDFFDELAGSAEPFFDAFNTLSLRGAGYMGQLGAAITDSAERFNDWIQEADEAGKINVWIENGVKSFQDMWSVLGSTVDMFQALTKAANDAGATGLDGLARRMEELAEIMNGEPFQSRLSTIFDGARQGATNLNTGVKDLGRTFGESAENVSYMLELLGSIGGGALSNVASALNQPKMQGGLIDGLRGMKSLLDDMGPGFDALGRIVGNFASMAGGVLSNVGTPLSNILLLLDEIVEQISGELTKAIPSLTGGLNSFVSLLSGPLHLAADVLESLLGAFNAMPGPIKDAVVALGALTAMRSTLSGMFHNVRSSSMTAFSGLAGFVKQADGSLRDMHGNVVTTSQALATLGPAGQKSFPFLRAGFQQASALINSGNEDLRRYATSVGQVGVGRAAIGHLTAAFTDLRNASQRVNMDGTAKGISALGQAALSAGGHVGAAAGLGLRGAMSGLMGALGGPWGMALMAGGLAVSAFAKKNAEAKREAAALGETLDQTTGAVTRATKAMAVDKLLEGRGGFNGWIDDLLGKHVDATKALDEIGVSVSKASDLALEGGPAFDEMIAALEALERADPENEAYDVAIDRLKSLREATDEQQEATRKHAEALGITGPAAQKMSDAMGVLRDNTASASEKVDAMRQAMELLAGDGTVSARDAEFNAKKVLDANLEMAKGMADAIAQSEVSLTTADGLLNKLHPQAGALRDSMREAADSIAENAFAAYQAAIDDGELASEAVKKANGIIAEGDEWLQQFADSAGVSVEQLKGEWGTFFDTPWEMAAHFTGTTDQLLAAKKEAERLGVEFDGEEFMAWLLAQNDPASVSIEEAQEWMRGWENRTAVATIDADDERASKKLADAMGSAEEWDNAMFMAYCNLDDTEFKAKNEQIMLNLIELARQNPTILVDIDPQIFENRKAQILAEIEELDKKEPTPEVKARIEELESQLNKANLVLSEIERRETVATLTGDKGGFDAAMAAAQEAGAVFETQQFVSWLDANKDRFDGKQMSAKQLGEEFARYIFESKLDADPAGFNNKKSNADREGNNFRLTTFQAKLDGDHSPFRTKRGQAHGYGDEFGRNWYYANLGAKNAVGDGIATASTYLANNWTNRTFETTLSAKAAIGALNGAFLPSVYANGGINALVKKFANGGVENHVAQISRGQTPYRIWSEPETGGEAYIPLSVTKRTRSTQILQQVASHFGMNVVPATAYANGGTNGLTSAGRTGAGVAVNIGSYVTNKSDTPDDVARALMRRIKAQGAYSPLEAF